MARISFGVYDSGEFKFGVISFNQSQGNMFMIFNKPNVGIINNCSISLSKIWIVQVCRFLSFLSFFDLICYNLFGINCGSLYGKIW